MSTKVWPCIWGPTGAEARTARTNGFTLIELLVVVSIVSLLMAILLPALQNARQVARGAVCLSNQKQIGLLFHSYASDNKGWIPPTYNHYGPAYSVFPWRGWFNFMFAQMGISATADAPKLFYCPDFPGTVDKNRGCYGMNQYVGNEDAVWSRQVWNHNSSNWNNTTRYFNIELVLQPNRVYLVSDGQNNASNILEYWMQTDLATGETVARWHNERINVLFMDGGARTQPALANALGRFSPGYLPWMNRTAYSTTYPLP
jgi:prepilin-type N-terminal cleavage/methylation domain-containing protein/prepilin-type processing-associated H-X9-DG protein